ncbi:MAG: YggS family pyridoxal phosphate-dependent enzyme [Candidatus Acidiferrales bacterium]
MRDMQRNFSVAENLSDALARIAQAASRSGRHAEDVTLIAVSKTFPAPLIREAYAAGARHFGESRIQEWESKRPEVADLNAVWHFVGHLQSNKAARAATLFHAIDSLDSLELARRLERARTALDPAPSARLRVLIEVRLDAAPAKSGVREEDLDAVADGVLALPHLELRGLMGVPPPMGDAPGARPAFRRLRELRDALERRIGTPLPVLSMGMSHDFEVAIEEGSTEVRVGTAIFGDRKLAQGAH